MPVNEKDFHHVRLEKENAEGLAPIAKENRRSIVQETNVAVENHIRNHKGSSRQRRKAKRESARKMKQSARG